MSENIAAWSESRQIMSEIESLQESHESSLESTQAMDSPRASDEAMAAWPAALREKFTPLRKLGQGTQGNVYLAVRKSDGQKVAVKAIRIHSVQNWKEYDLFKREAMALQSLQIKGVAKFYDYDEFLEEQNPVACIAQEYIDGRSLQDMIRSGYRFTMRKIFQMAGQILDILEKLHSHEPPIIHRDIKPSNILIKTLDADHFEVYLIDFGAVANPQVQGGGSTVAGTYGYMPPEQLMGTPCAASDFYSFAATLVHVLSGVEPSLMEVSDFRLVIDPHLQNIPRPIVRLLHRMLEPQAESRFTDVHAIREMFKAFAQERFPMMQDDAESLSLVSDAQKWNESLQNVQQLGQPGNMDLWMALPESAKRGDLPKCLSRRLSCDLQDDSKTGKVFSILILLVYLFIPAFILAMFIIWIVHSSAREHLGVLFALSIGIAMILALYLGFGRGWRKISTRKKSKSTIGKTVAALYDHGRKGIATVVNVTCVGVKAEDIVESLARGGGQYYSQKPLLYRVRYSFNPPDDNLPDALTHEVVVCQDPAGVLRPGTPLPILYLVSNDSLVSSESHSRVVSMPFPLPPRMLGVWNPDCCCTTVNGEKAVGLATYPW